MNIDNILKNRQQSIIDNNMRNVSVIQDSLNNLDLGNLEIGRFGSNERSVSTPKNIVDTQNQFMEDSILNDIIPYNDFIKKIKKLSSVYKDIILDVEILSCITQIYKIGKENSNDLNSLKELSKELLLLVMYKNYKDLDLSMNSYMLLTSYEKMVSEDTKNLYDKIGYTIPEYLENIRALLVIPFAIDQSTLLEIKAIEFFYLLGNTYKNI